jgi:hypothetical protein
MEQVSPQMKSSASKSSLPKKAKAVEGFKCSFCDKVYKTEKPFLNHVCRQKKRYFEKDTKAARLAFAAYTKFYEVHMPANKPPTYEAFSNNSLYEVFLSFGKYILDIDAISPKDYIDYMVRSKVKIDYWCRDSEYEKYVVNLAMKETPERALERTCLLMQEWALKQSADSSDFFRLISPSLASMWIKSGRISPWVLLNCDSGVALLGRLSDEQMMMISGALNTRMWKGKFSRQMDEVRDIRAALEASGL